MSSSSYSPIPFTPWSLSLCFLHFFTSYLLDSEDMKWRNKVDFLSYYCTEIASNKVNILPKPKVIIIIAPLWSLLCVRHYSKCLIYINSFKSYNHLYKVGTIITLILQLRHWKLNNLTKVSVWCLVEPGFEPEWSGSGSLLWTTTLFFSNTLPPISADMVDSILHDPLYF